MSNEALMSHIRDYLSHGKLLHLATTMHGAPWLSHVWYAVGANDTLVFTSNKGRRHSAEIASSPLVAGGVVAIELDGLGQRVRGLSFEGRAMEAEDITNAYEAYAKRWPQVRKMFSARDIEAGATNMRMYLIEMRRVVLFDEVNYPSDPRQEIILA